MTDPVDRAGDRTLAEAHARLAEIARRENLLDDPITVAARTLTPEEAIGTPERRDYPILAGRERIIEARFHTARGHSFTDAPCDWTGTLAQVIEAVWTGNRERALFTATLNAVLAHLGLNRSTVHCRDEEPEQCAREIAGRLQADHGDAAVGLIGLNPALAEALVRTFGAGRVRITDLNPEDIGGERFGVEVWDGRTRMEELVVASNVILVTGTTLVNGTFDRILDAIGRHGRAYLVYGVTVAGVAALCDLPRICPCGRIG